MFRFGEFSAEQCLAEDKLISVQNFEEVYTQLKPLYQQETLHIERDPLGGNSRLVQLPPSESNVAKVRVEWLTLGNVVRVPCVERLGVKFVPLFLVQQAGGLFKDLAFAEAFAITREERCAMDLLLHASGLKTAHVPPNCRLISYDMVRVLTPLLPAGEVELSILNPPHCARFMPELPAPPATADAASAPASASASNAAPIPSKSKSVSATRTAAAEADSSDTIVLDDSPSDPEAELDLQAPESEPVPPASEASSVAARDQLASQAGDSFEPGIVAHANGGIDTGGDSVNAEENARENGENAEEGLLEAVTYADEREFENASALASAASPNTEYASAATAAAAEGVEAAGEEEETQARPSVFQLFNECLGGLSAIGREPAPAGDTTATATSPEKPRKKEIYLLVSDVAMALAEYDVTSQMLECHLQAAGLLVQPSEEERAKFCELDQVDHLDPHETMARIQSFRYVLRQIDEKRGC